MHDPMTVAFEIRRIPWRDAFLDKAMKKYNEAVITIWHVDPESDGTDDSCGFGYPNVDTKAEWVKELISDIKFEMRDDGVEALRRQRRKEGSVAWWLLWLSRASFRHRGRPLSPTEIARELFNSSYPGNRDGDYVEDDPERCAWIIARCYLNIRQRWYQHARWHFWHWKIQIHPIQKFKRWAFSRCAGCKGRFTWGYSPVSTQWSSGGPRWFRSQPNIHHFECVPAALASTGTQKEER